MEEESCVNPIHLKMFKLRDDAIVRVFYVLRGRGMESKVFEGVGLEC